jgi:YD repeat-containing protein
MTIMSLDISKTADAAVPVRKTIPTPCCTGMFKPTAGKKYIISAWVRETGNPLAYTFTGPTITVDNTTFSTSGNIIDGWQLIRGEFLVPANATALNLKFNKANMDTYFDDIRIFPVDAKMTTYVYDQNTLKLTFTNDENNYFTKYNYDGEDNLQSINKETEQGVQTIKEARSLTRKKQ